MAIDETYMDYDYDFHRYKLTIDTCNKYTGLDPVKLFGTREKAKIKLDEMSRQVYDEAYLRQLPRDKKVLEFRIFDEEEARNGIMWAMIEQYKYAITSSGNLVGDLTGLDPNTGLLTDYAELNKRLVSPLVKQTLRRYEIHTIKYSYRISDEDYRNGY